MEGEGKVMKLPLAAEERSSSFVNGFPCFAAAVIFVNRDSESESSDYHTFLVLRPSYGLNTLHSHPAHRFIAFTIIALLRLVRRGLRTSI